MEITAGDAVLSLGINAAFNYGGPKVFNKVKNTKFGQAVSGKISNVKDVIKGKVGGAFSAVKEKVSGKLASAGAEAVNANSAVSGAGRKTDFYVGKEGIATSLQEYDDFVGSVGNPVEVTGYGHTGRIIPNSLKEQMAMRAVRSNPLDGATELPFAMHDSRWSANDGWVKMQNNIYYSNGEHTSIHFVYNKNTGEFDDFKYKDK